MAESADCHRKLCLLWLVGLALSVPDSVHISVQLLQRVADREIEGDQTTPNPSYSGGETYSGGESADGVRCESDSELPEFRRLQVL